MHERQKKALIEWRVNYENAILLTRLCCRQAGVAIVGCNGQDQFVLA